MDVSYFKPSSVLTEINSVYRVFKKIGILKS